MENAASHCLSSVQMTSNIEGFEEPTFIHTNIDEGFEGPELVQVFLELCIAASKKARSLYLREIADYMSKLDDLIEDAEEKNSTGELYNLNGLKKDVMEYASRLPVMFFNFRTVSVFLFVFFSLHSTCSMTVRCSVPMDYFRSCKN